MRELLVENTQFASGRKQHAENHQWKNTHATNVKRPKNIQSWQQRMKVVDVARFAPVINYNHRQIPQKWVCCFNLLCIPIELDVDPFSCSAVAQKTREGFCKHNLPNQVESGEYFVVNNKNETEKALGKTCEMNKAVQMKPKLGPDQLTQFVYGVGQQ